MGKPKEEMIHCKSQLQRRGRTSDWLQDIALITGSANSSDLDCLGLRGAEHKGYLAAVGFRHMIQESQLVGCEMV